MMEVKRLAEAGLQSGKRVAVPLGAYGRTGRTGRKLRWTERRSSGV